MLEPWQDPLQLAPMSPDPLNFHLFFFPPGAFPFYNYSNAQSAPGGSVNYERKSFRLAATAAQGVDPAAGASQFVGAAAISPAFDSGDARIVIGAEPTMAEYTDHTNTIGPALGSHEDRVHGLEQGEDDATQTRRKHENSPLGCAGPSPRGRDNPGANPGRDGEPLSEARPRRWSIQKNPTP